MNKIEIYYFSGTGNSLAVAKDLGEKLNAKLLSVSSIMDNEGILRDADVIGLVFPIYDFKPPKIIVDFINKLANLDAKYVFAVCTYGIAPYNSLKYLDKIIKSCGGTLSLGFAVEMPHNGIGSGKLHKIEHYRMFVNWKKRLEGICENIKNRKKGEIESSNLLKIKCIRMIPTLLKFIIYILFKGIKSLELTTNENCNGCGICARICPIKNIEIQEKKPKWAEHCASCFACLHWCPEEAISLGGKDMNIEIYHHPDIRITDMMR